MNYLRCAKCGAEIWMSDAGTTHHWGDNLDDIDYELDADHVPILDEESVEELCDECRIPEHDQCGMRVAPYCSCCADSFAAVGVWL